MTKKEFAKYCGINTRELSVYLKRNKVVADDEDEIDPDNDVNLAFYAHKKAKQAVKAKPEYNENEEDEPDESGLMPLATSERMKKHFEAETQESISVLKELDIQRKTGEAIPTVAVESLFDETLRIFAIDYRDLYEREVQKIAAMAGFSAKDIADLRNSGINNINLAYQKAIERCKSSISVIVGDNALKRGVGERL